ncbi:hypothetical protein Hypma_016458 [Hypsizygus marmoreus]|uniref:C2H2-type domain-containing protein n=1 Tax=Hypsizygus marmoreus TaxID=39966 RepID=A0A369J096_HYPMA|nr:hypothetical protein Hypma_016458 [Hypsizygus marmoreus]
MESISMEQILFQAEESLGSSTSNADGVDWHTPTLYSDPVYLSPLPPQLGINEDEEHSGSIFNFATNSNASAPLYAPSSSTSFYPFSGSASSQSALFNPEDSREKLLAEEVVWPGFHDVQEPNFHEIGSTNFPYSITISVPTPRESHDSGIHSSWTTPSSMPSSISSLPSSVGSTFWDTEPAYYGSTAIESSNAFSIPPRLTQGENDSYSNWFSPSWDVIPSTTCATPPILSSPNFVIDGQDLLSEGEAAEAPLGSHYDDHDKGRALTAAYISMRRSVATDLDENPTQPGFAGDPPLAIERDEPPPFQPSSPTPPPLMPVRAARGRKSKSNTPYQRTSQTPAQQVRRKILRGADNSDGPSIPLRTPGVPKRRRAKQKQAASGSLALPSTIQAEECSRLSPVSSLPVPTSFLPHADFAANDGENSKPPVTTPSSPVPCSPHDADRPFATPAPGSPAVTEGNDTDGLHLSVLSDHSHEAGASDPSPSSPVQSPHRHRKAKHVSPYPKPSPALQARPKKQPIDDDDEYKPKTRVPKKPLSMQRRIATRRTQEASGSVVPHSPVAASSGMPHSGSQAIPLRKQPALVPADRVCDQCQEIFSRAADARRHRKYVCLPLGQKRKPCEKCGDLLTLREDARGRHRASGQCARSKALRHKVIDRK